MMANDRGPTVSPNAPSTDEILVEMGKPRARAAFALTVGILVSLAAILIRVAYAPSSADLIASKTQHTLTAMGLVVACLLAAWLARPRSIAWWHYGTWPMAAGLTLSLPMIVPFQTTPSLDIYVISIETGAGLALLLGVFAWINGKSLARLQCAMPNTRAKIRYVHDDAIKTMIASLVPEKAEVLLSPGDEVPADGVLISGSGFVDEQLVTGYELPVAKQPGDLLFAGSSSTISDGIMRCDVSQENSYLTRRRRLERTLSTLVYRPRTKSHVLSILSMLVIASVVTITWQLATPESWVPWCGVLCGLLLTGSGLSAMLILGRTRAEALRLGADEGVLFGRLRDVERIARVRNWQLDPRLLLQIQNVQIHTLREDFTEEQVLQVAQALTAEIEGTLVSALQDHFVKNGREKLRAAALKQSNGVFHGTVRGDRWFMGNRGALKGEEGVAASAEQTEALSNLCTENHISWLLGKPGEGVYGAVIIGIDVDRAVSQLGRALNMSLMPGLSDGIREILASRAQIEIDGPPVGRNDATVVLESSPRPSTGLRLVVVQPSLDMLVERGRSPRIMRSALSSIPNYVSSVRVLSRRCTWISVAVIGLPLLLGAGLGWLGWYGPWTASLLVGGSGILAIKQLTRPDVLVEPDTAP